MTFYFMEKKKFFSKKRTIWLVVIILVAGAIAYSFLRPKNNSANIQTETIQRQDLTATVLTTGQVVSQTNLDLSFQGSGVVKVLNIKAGSKVKAGQILATLDQASARAALLSAQGSLAQAQANYDKVAQGATQQQIDVAKKAADSAKVSYQNAVNQLSVIKQTAAANLSQVQSALADLQSPNTQSDNKRSAIVVTIAKELTIVKTDLDQEKLILDDNNLKDTFSVSNVSYLNNFKMANSQVPALLNKAETSLAAAQVYKSDSNIDQAISDAVVVLNENIQALNYCYSALQASITSPKLTQVQIDTYKTAVSGGIGAENSGITSINSARQALTNALTSARNAVTNATLAQTQQITTAQNTINSAQAAWQQAQATLAQQQAPATSAELAAARAQIVSAQGSVAAAQINLDNTVLKAPVDGTITSVDTKIGQQVQAMQEVFVLQNIASLHAEAYVSEANIASLKVGQDVDYTFDALGPNRHFSGKIISIDPASTVISGVVDYLVKTSLPNILDIKPGMTANLTVKVANKNQVLAVPSSALIDQNGQSYVRVVDNPQTKSYHQVLVKTGLQADGGLVEIRSGLQEGQEIVTYVKS